MQLGCLFDQVLYFDYGKFKGNVFEDLPKKDFRVKDWGPAPRWVAFVDFFLASRAKYAVVSGAHRRVGTTYAQLIAALAATRNLGKCTVLMYHFLFLFVSSNAPLKHLQTVMFRRELDWFKFFIFEQFP